MVLDEVVDLHDVRVLDLGEEPALGECGSHGVLVAVVEEALQHDPPLGHEVVAGQVDPAKAAVGEAPTTSYWPPTIVPGVSEARNENGAPHERQNPSVRPGRPLRVRPTGSSQREQKRRCSATVGSAITAVGGSRAGMGGMSTMPAPRRPRLTVVDVLGLTGRRRAGWRRTVPLTRGLTATGGGWRHPAVVAVALVDGSRAPGLEALFGHGHVSLGTAPMVGSVGRHVEVRLEPPLVQLAPRAVGAQVLEHGVDEAHELWVLVADGDAVVGDRVRYCSAGSRSRRLTVGSCTSMP